MDRIAAIFSEMSEETPNNDIAAALLTLGVVLEGISERLSERLSHDICLGLRYGLFGINAPNGTSIRDLSLDLAGAMEQVTVALEDMQLQDIEPNKEDHERVQRTKKE